MLVSPIDARTWAGIGALCVLLVGLAAHRMGYLHFDLMRQAHYLNVTKAVPRIGCSVEVEKTFSNGVAFPPLFFVNIKIYNEGELPAQNINGEWKLSTSDPLANGSFPIQRDFLGKCQEQPYRHKITESYNWRREGVIIEVEIEFDYAIPSDDKPAHYHAKYRYTGQNDQTIKI